MSWDADGIVFGQGSKGIMRVSANGGQPELLASVKDGELAHGPQVLPGGEWLLFTLATAATADGWDKAQIVVQSLKSSERKTLVSGGSDGRYLPTGHLVYALGGVLFAVPFDLRRLAVTGGPVPIVEGVRRSAQAPPAAAHFSVSSTGSLVFVPGPASTSSAQLRSRRCSIAKADRQPLKLPPGAVPDCRACLPTASASRSAATMARRPASGSTICPGRARCDGSRSGRAQPVSRLVRGRPARRVPVGSRGRPGHLLAARGRHRDGGAADEGRRGSLAHSGIVGP